MRTIFVFLFFVILITPLFAQENIDPQKKYIVTGEQLLYWQAHIIELEQFVSVLTNSLTEKETYILILKSEIEELKIQYEYSRRGFWAGLGAGYPLGAQAITLYQFNERFGIFLIGGYNNNWSINAGIITRIK